MQPSRCLVMGPFQTTEVPASRGGWLAPGGLNQEADHSRLFFHPSVSNEGLSHYTVDSHMPMN